MHFSMVNLNLHYSLPTLLINTKLVTPTSLLIHVTMPTADESMLIGITTYSPTFNIQTESKEST